MPASLQNKRDFNFAQALILFEDGFLKDNKQGKF